MILKLLTLAAFLTAIVIGPIALFRIFRAKTRTDYLKNVALFVVPILLTFFLADLAGIDTGQTSDRLPPSIKEMPSVRGILGKMPLPQVVLMASGFGLWLIGGNVLMHFHNKRLGKRWWQGLNPLDPPLKDFNKREWWAIATLLVASFALLVAGVNVGR